MYLPLRYWTWARLNQDRNATTEELLGRLTLGVEQSLWSGMCQSSPIGNATLVDLVLGSDNPLRLSGSERARWDAKMANLITGMSQACRYLDEWSRWDAMALHFVSFYLPMGLPRMDPGFEVPMSGLNAGLLTALKERLHPDVVTLIRAWSASAASERDEAGVPVVSWRVPSEHRLFGRTRIELLLMASS